MEIKGIVKQMLPIKNGVSQMGKPWSLLSFVIETQEQYPKQVCIEIFGEENINKFSPLLVEGNIVKVSFDIESREFNSRWYTSVRAWKVEKGDDEPAQVAEPTTPQVIKPEGGDTDLPF